MLKLKSCALILSLLTASCANVPSVQQIICPKMPELDSEPIVAQTSFTERMQKVLQGSLEMPNKYALPTGSAKLSTTQQPTP